MNPKHFLPQHLLAILMLSLSVVACGPGQLLGPTLTPTPTATPSPTPAPTLTPTPTASPTPAFTPTPAASGMEGSVFWGSAKTPITNFTLTLESARKFEATTDSQGKYAFTDLEPGTYSISIAWNLTKTQGFSCNQFSINVPSPLEGTALSFTGTNNSGENIFISVGLEVTIEPNSRLTADFEVEC